MLFVLVLAVSASLAFSVPHKRDVEKKDADEGGILCPADWVANKPAESCFKVAGPENENYKNWNDAKHYCENIAKTLTGDIWVGRLAELREGVQAAFIINNVLPGAAVEQVWLGAQGDDKSGFFKWDTNQREVGNETTMLTTKKPDQCLTINTGEGKKDHFDIAHCVSGHFRPLCQISPEVDSQCNDMPWNHIPNTLPSLGAFQRFEGSQVRLNCKLGFSEQENLPVFGMCEKVNGKLKWTSCGECKMIDPYCKGDPAAQVSHVERVRRDTYMSRLGDSARILCRKGYKANVAGEVVSECREKDEAEGEWVANGDCVPVEPYCKDSPLSVVPNSDNALIYRGPTTLGVVVDIPCKLGYYSSVITPIKVRCQAHNYDEGIWIVLRGECLVIKTFCDATPHAHFQNTLPAAGATFERTFLSVVRLECDLGYKSEEGFALDGVCWSNRAWRSLEACDPIPNYCPPLKERDIPNMAIVEREAVIIVHSEIVLQCVSGYESTVKRLYAKCTQKEPALGVWIVYGTCQMKDPYCRETEIWSKFTGVVKITEGISRTVGSKLTLSCLPGKIADEATQTSSFDIQCAATDADRGTWIGPFSGCHNIKPYCDESPEKAVANSLPPANPPKASEIADVVDLYCKKGFKTEKGVIAKAQCSFLAVLHGKWTSPQDCNIIPDYCPAHPEHFFRHVEKTKESEYRRAVGSVAILSCKKGFLAVATGWEKAIRVWTETTFSVRCSESSDLRGIWISDQGIYCECTDVIDERYEQLRKEIERKLIKETILIIEKAQKGLPVTPDEVKIAEANIAKLRPEARADLQRFLTPIAPAPAAAPAAPAAAAAAPAAAPAAAKKEAVLKAFEGSPNLIKFFKS